MENELFGNPSKEEWAVWKKANDIVSKPTQRRKVNRLRRLYRGKGRGFTKTMIISYAKAYGYKVKFV